MVGGEKRIKTMNEITPTRPSKVKKSKIRPKLKPIVSPTDDNYDDEGELGYGEWTPSKRRQQSPENDTPKDDEKKDERCDTLKLELQSESNEEIRTDNAISNASDDISLTKTQLSFDNKLKLSERGDIGNEKDNRANECVSQVTYSQKKLNEGNKSKCMNGVWIESTCSLLRSRVWQGFIILLCIAAICEVLCISIVIKCRLSHVESSNISDTSALEKELSYVDYKEESSNENNNISETGREVLPITEMVEESVVNETSSLLDEEIQDASEVEVKNMGSEEVTAPVKEANASETDELVKEVENEEVPSLRETQDAPEIEMQFRAGQEASSVLEEEVTEDNAPTIELDNEKATSPLVEERFKTDRFNLGKEGEETQDPSGMRHEKHEEGEVVSQTQAAHLKNEQVGVAIEDDSQDITTPQKESLSLSDEVDQGMISTESDQDAYTTLNLLRDEEHKMKLGLGMTRSDEEHNHSDNLMIPSVDEALESDSDELPEMIFVEVDLEASDELPDTRSKEIKGVNNPLPNINALENVESDQQGYGNPNLIGVEKDGADTKGSSNENEHELHKEVRPLTKETKREFLAKLNQFEDAFESYEVIDALIGHVACAIPKLLLKRVLGLFSKVTFSRK